MTHDRALHDVLAAWPPVCQPRQITPLGWAGGLSGAMFWRFDTPLGALCLRRSPEGPPDHARLKWIHSVLRHAAERGFDRLPLPIRTRDAEDRDAEDYVESAGHVWELTPWLPGRADYRSAPSPEKLAAAFVALAEFHLATADFPREGSQSAVAPALLGRLHRIEQLHSGGLQRLEEVVKANGGNDLAGRGDELLRGFRQLAAALRADLEKLRHVVPLQPCLRDIHDRHVLFQGSRVSGLVDFDALKIDNVATDVARLLGTTALDAPADRDAALAAYQRRRPLSDVERRLVDALDRANVALSGVQWLEWLLIEQRQFERPDVVLERIDAILGRVRRATVLAGCWPP